MDIKNLAFILALTSVTTLTGCGGGSSSDTNTDTDTDTDTDNPAPTTYDFKNSDGVSTVSYTGQTARQVLVSDLVDEMNTQTRSAANTPADIVKELEFFYSEENTDAATRDSNYNATFALSGDENIIGNDTDAAESTIAPADISSGKVVKSKIAGVDSKDGDKEAYLLGDGSGNKFFGWEGFDTPAKLMDEFFRILGQESADETSSIVISGGTIVPIPKPTVTESGLDIRQLVQKFLLGALTFSQGTADYLSIDYGSDKNLKLEEGKTYTAGAHDFDEAFGYFGAARNYNDLDDSVIASGYKFTESDTVVVDSAIDVRSEYNFANSQNCAKRDLGSAGNANPTDFTKEAFDAFLAGRQILQDAATGATESTPGSLSDEAEAELTTQITIAAQTWEKCIAATVVHYINDVTADMDKFIGDDFAEIKDFHDLAKHWAEMKGFALGLQFSPYSPFRTGKVYVNGDEQTVDVGIDDLKEVLALMGDAPVLADGTQDGSPYNDKATAAEARTAYLADLRTARDILQAAYAFDADNVANW